MGIQEAFIALAKDPDISGRPRRILDYLFGRLGFKNYICITQKEISEEPKLGRTVVYRLNSVSFPDFFCQLIVISVMLSSFKK